MRVSLLPRKCNVAELEPRGFEFVFGTEAILTRVVKTDEVPTEETALREQLLEMLAQGPQTLADMIEYTQSNPSTVRWHLTVLKRQGTVINTSRGCWALSEAESGA